MEHPYKEALSPSNSTTIKCRVEATAVRVEWKSPKLSYKNGRTKGKGKKN